MPSHGPNCARDPRELKKWPQMPRKGRLRPRPIMSGVTFTFDWFSERFVRICECFRSSLAKTFGAHIRKALRSASASPVRAPTLSPQCLSSAPGGSEEASIVWGACGRTGSRGRYVLAPMPRPC